MSNISNHFGVASLNEDADVGGSAPAAGTSTSSVGECPGCAGSEVHLGSCPVAIQQGLPRAGFGYVLGGAHHHKHKKHHHTDESAVEVTPSAMPLEEAKEKEEESKEPVVEGQYLQSGLSTRPAPIPFTQDPNCEGVKDYLNDEEKAASGAHMQQTGMPAETGSSMEESMNIMDQFKKGDKVCIDHCHDVEWMIESIHSNPDKVTVTNGKKRKVVSPSTNFIEHLDGVEIHKERQFENIETLKEAYKKMSFDENPRALKANWCTYEEGAVAEKVENKLPILEKEQLYSFIKENEYDQMDEVAAFQQLCEKFGNSIEQLESVMADAHLSNSNAEVDKMYNFNATPYEENSIGLSTTLENAWKEMEKKEIEETAKIHDEESDNTQGNGGLGIKFNL